MEKTKVLCLILAIVLASAGTAGIVMGFGGEAEKPIIPDNAVNTVLDKPDEGTPIDRSAIDNLYIAQGELQRKGSFVGTTRGSTTSAGIKQEVINNRVVVNGNVFKEMVTVGVVKNAYQLFIYDGNYLYRKFDVIKSAGNIKWDNTASKYNENDFLMKFGHRSDALTGYILNDSTIVSGELEKEENGLFQYRYVLDINTAPARMLYEMKTNSNMSGYSTFIKAEIIVVMDKDWQVKTVTTDCKYKVPMFGGLDCVEDITETFSDFEGEELPEKDFFEKFFDAEVQTPVDKDPDALSILMDIFAPYIGSGKNLNASLTASNNGQPVLNGLVSAKIDVENLDNIEVFAKIGDDLFVEYQQGNLFVTYQDFKASTTVNGIMAVVDAFMQQTGVAGQSYAEETDDDILSKFTYSIENGLCTVSLPLDIGKEKLELNIYASVTDGGFQFLNANVTFGSLELNVELANEFEIPARSGEYPEILGLLDIVKNGVIYGNVNAFGLDVDVMLDLATMSLYADGGNISVVYKDNVVYAELGAIKAKLAVSDVDRIMTLLRLAGVVDGNAAIELPQISVEQILSLLGSIKATDTENGVQFNLDMDGLSVAVYLTAGENGWNLNKVTVAFGDSVVTLSSTASIKPEIPEVNESEYADVMELINTFVNPIASLISAASYGAEFNFGVTVDGKTYDIAGDFAYDVNKNIEVNAVIASGSAKLVKANVVVADNVVYLDLNGLKTAFAVGEMPSDIDLLQVVSGIYGLNDNVDGILETIYKIVEFATNLDLSEIDFVNLITSFAFQNGELAMTVNADFLGLGEIGIKLSADRFNNLAVGVNRLEIGNIGLNAEVRILANVVKVKVPNAADYILSLKGSVEDIEFAVTADLLNMDVYASVDMFNNTMLVRFVDNKVYLNVGEIAVVGAVSELGALVDYVMSAIGADNSSIDTSIFANLDLSAEKLFNSINVNTDNVLQLELRLDGFANVSVNFDSDANFVDITADVMGRKLQVEKSDNQAEKLDVGKVYIPVETLAKHFVEIYDSYKNILNTGVAANIEASINVNGNDYALTATFNYNNGLYVNANIADNVNALVAIDMYLVNSVLYLDVNGIRVATKLPKADFANNANVDLASVLRMLNQAKGYNEVLDSVISALEQLPANLEGINCLDLLSKLTYDNGLLTVGVNGEMLGLSDFELTFAGTRELNATISNLAIGNVTVAKLNVNVLPECSQVTAPASEYVTELEVEVMGYKVTAKLDLYNKTAVAKTALLGHELGVCYANNTVYVSYGAVKAKLDVADFDKLLVVISTFIDGGIPDVTMPELDVKQVLNSLSKVVTASGYDFKATVAGVKVTLSFGADAKFTNAYVNINDLDVSAKLINGATYPSFDFGSDYVDLVAVLETFASDVKNIMNAEGYDVTLNGSFAFDNNVYNIQANVIFNGGLYVNANVSYNTANMANVELWLVDNVLYVSMGDLKLALDLPQSAKSAQNSGISKIDLTAYMGCNPYVDGVLNVVQGAIDKFVAGNVDYISLINGLIFDNGELTLNLNGEQLGLALQSVTLAANNGLIANVSNLVVDRMTANLTATVKASNVAVTAPQGDFTTNLKIIIDDKNTLYANIDIINGVYNFRLDDLYVTYADNIVKINKGDIYVSGNINQILEYVKKIDDLVNEFSGAEQSAISKIDLDMFKNVDVKAIVSSLVITASGDVATLSVSAFGLDLTAAFANGKLRVATVPISLIDKTVEIETCAPQTFDKFNGEHKYLQIEQVFNDYFPAIERLVHTNSWKFNFDGDALISIGKTSYKVAAGSYLEFYYKNTEGFETFKLRAQLDVYKQKSDGSWQAFMLIDAAFKDGSIYVTDTGREVDGKRSTIKLTVSVDTLMKCVGLYDKLVEVIPQMGEIVDNVKKTMQEAENNADNISYSTILNDVSYRNDVFGLVLNGSPLLSKLGVVALSAQTFGEGLSLNSLELTYDTLSVQVKDLRVYASEVDANYTEENKTDAKWFGGKQYNAVQDILAYDTANHMDFNSLYELLNSFIITATPVEGSNGVRSFFVEGTATVKLKVIGINVADITMGLSVKVDITEDNKVYIAVKISRTKPSGFGTAFVDVYNDKGGDSYLYYDGVNETFGVIRNSVSDKEIREVEETYYYCPKCNKEYPTKLCVWAWHNSSMQTLTRTVQKEFSVADYLKIKDFAAENLTTEQFTANIMDYILELFNFGSTIKDPIVKAINEPKDTDFGIEDILKDYTYDPSYAKNESGEYGKYALKADLTAIDGNLGAIGADILYVKNHIPAENENKLADYSLTDLNVNVVLLGGMCNASIPFKLMPSTHRQATDIVTKLDHSTQFWI